MHALGAGEFQVARSHECDWPESVLELPQTTSTKFKVAGATSREIDTAVKTLIEQGLAVYEVDADALKSLAPDVILTQDQCEVCAVSLADVERAVAGWTECHANVVSLKPHTLADIYADNIRIAHALGRPAAGHALNDAMAVAFDEVRRAQHAADARASPSSSGLIRRCQAATGCRSSPASPVRRTCSVRPAGSRPIPLDEIIGADPDIILVAPCGYDLDKDATGDGRSRPGAALARLARGALGTAVHRGWQCVFQQARPPPCGERADDCGNRASRGRTLRALWKIRAKACANRMTTTSVTV